MTHTAKYTPGPSCTCQVRHYRHDTGIGVMEETDINICPFHAAAPAMYEALRAIIKNWERGDLAAAVRQGAAALAQADGKQKVS